LDYFLPPLLLPNSGPSQPKTVKQPTKKIVPTIHMIVTFLPCCSCGGSATRTTACGCGLLLLDRLGGLGGRGEHLALFVPVLPLPQAQPEHARHDNDQKHCYHGRTKQEREHG